MFVTNTYTRYSSECFYAFSIPTRKHILPIIRESKEVGTCIFTNTKISVFL